MRRPMSFGYCAGLPTDTTRLEGITAMAKVISTLFISADGVAEIDPDWHFPYFDDNMGRAVGEDYDTADVLLIGRETYDSFAGAWPGREAAGGDDAPFASDSGGVLRELVRLAPAAGVSPWRKLAELIKADLLDAVTSLQADAASRTSLVPGSIPSCGSLSPQELVDGLRLLVRPVGAHKGASCSTTATRRTTWRSTTTPSIPDRIDAT